MPFRLHPRELRRKWRTGEEVALFDLREEIAFSQAHPLFAVSLPLSRLERDIHALVPRQGTLVAIYDDGEGLAERGARLIEALGYGNVAVLEGGLAGYRALGEVYRDVNVPSKAFGELVESIRHTPSLSAAEVAGLIGSQADISVLDCRPLDEYRVMNIPGGVSVPGGELVLRAATQVASPETLVVVNCAGRTRSIIGTQSLINAGFPNQVAALRNGTIGWTLAGRTLDHGQDRQAPKTEGATLAAARANAARWAAHVGVPVIGRDRLDAWARESAVRTLYRLDVRDPLEYAAGHPAGFASAPGGQLVQAADEWLAVRGARIVLFDDDGVRAPMAASWLHQMGWEVAVIEEGILAKDEAGQPVPPRPPLPDAGAFAVTAKALSRRDAPMVLDLAPSPAYRAGHLPGARFILRSRFHADLAALPGDGPLVLTSPDGIIAAFAAADARQATSRPVHVLTGGTEAWVAAGLPLEKDAGRWASPPDDVYKRPYEGTDNGAQAMQAYIDWELQLVAQLANDGIANFRVAR